MYINHVYVNIGMFMALQIANPVVVGKIEQLAALTGLNKTAAVELAVEALLVEAQASVATKQRAGRIEALLAQIDRLPDRPDAFDPLEWDEHGLPK